jgi:hypothetical protein
MYGWVGREADGVGRRGGVFGMTEAADTTTATGRTTLRPVVNGTDLAWALV